MSETPEIITVICPKHGAHEHAIVSNIEGHEGVWCQICWTESMGPSMPYRKAGHPMNLEGCNPITPDSFLTMEEMVPVPEAGWMPMPKE